MKIGSDSTPGIISFFQKTSSHVSINLDIKHKKVISMSEDSRKMRAGVIVLKQYPDCYRILGLRIYGSFDLPKGGVDKGEELFQAALRETYEECGISDLNFKWGYETCQMRNVILFVACRFVLLPSCYYIDELV